MSTAKKILLVDDEADLLKIVTVRLKKSGYDVQVAKNGNEALERVKVDRPDLLILDVMMPPPNGYQVCRTLKDDPEYKNIPIILLTARATESDQFWGMEAGADRYVTKPFNSEDLLKEIQSLLV